jgi:chloramphenicol O-acetyltransferase type A
MPSAIIDIQPIDLNTWPRKQHFELFQHFSQPYFNVCVQLNAKPLYDYCKTHQVSFFQAYIYATLQACQAYEPIRLRIIEGKPGVLKSVRASVVELAADDTFRFSYFSQAANFNEFSKHVSAVSASTKANTLFSDAFQQTEGQADLIHISVLPWLNFSAFSHAFSVEQSLGIPKLVFGQYDKSSGNMPLAIDVHHALMDGLHVAKFINILQDTFAHFSDV